MSFESIIIIIIDYLCDSSGSQLAIIFKYIVVKSYIAFSYLMYTEELGTWMVYFLHKF